MRGVAAPRGTRPPATGFRAVSGWQVLSLTTFLVVWWLASQTRPPYFLPGPQRVLAGVWATVTSGQLAAALRISLTALATGGGLALAVGIPLGVAMGVWRVAELALDPYVSALYIAPVSALAPLAVFWFGIGIPARAAVVFIFTAPEIIITCFQGAKDTSRTFIDVARSFGASKRQIFWKVVIPHEVPYVITALRLGLAGAIKGMVLADLLIATTGLGELLDYFKEYFQTANLLGVVLTLMGLSVLGTAIIGRVERAVAPWRGP